MSTKNNLVTLLQEGAKAIANKYSLPQYQEGKAKYAEKQKALLHQQNCKDILAFAEAHKDIPLYFILSVGVATNACKVEEVKKGIKSFNADKVLAVHQMGMAYNKHNGVKGKMSDVTIRLMLRYYNHKSSDYGTFIADLQNSQVFGKECGARGDFGKLCANLNIPFEGRGKVKLADVA